MKSKNIFVIYTGGTICTTIKDGIMDTSSDAASALVEYYKKSSSVFKDRVNLIDGKNFGVLSENMTVNIWNQLKDYFLEHLSEFAQYDGIIVAHGTDTLAYTTSLFSVLLEGFSVPVIFVSSNYSVMQENGLPNLKANGSANFHAAVDCICQGIAPGVYTTYKNPEDGRMYLHHGGHLQQCAIYSENFYSRDAIDITDLNGVALEAVWPGEEKRLDELLITSLKDCALTNCVLKINPYVGLDYDMFDLAKVKAVFHSTYHSGTSCVVRTVDQPDYANNHQSVLYFFDKCAQQEVPVPFYYAPSKADGTVNVYASVPFLRDHVVNGQKPIFLFGETEELVYVKLVVAYSIGMEPKALEAFLR